jgi:drug/metabolite transporter (DMT)-like permease
VRSSSAPDQIRSDPGTVAAFTAIVLFGGFNALAVRVSDQELAPLWGAAVRFGLASLVLFSIMVVRRVPLPHGSALTGSVLYGLLGFAGAFGLIYWGLVDVPAGLGQTILALVPLLTFLFAVAQKLERFRWQSLGGAVVAALGIAVVFGDRVGGGHVPALSLLAILAAAACMAESNVVVKRFPKCHPVANNAIAMGVGAGTLLFVSFLLGEPRAVPAAISSWLAIAYLVLLGSVAVFSLFLFVISRWPASATSYVMLLMPIVAVAASAMIAREPVTAAFLAGGALVLAGVYLGAFAPSVPRRVPPQAALPGREPGAQVATPDSPLVAPQSTGMVTPGCA